MKILSAPQIRQLDQYTIAHEPVASVDLMERAAEAVVTELRKRIKTNRKVLVFCGMGNNGGDGLAIARMLLQQGYLHVSTYVVRHSPGATPDFLVNEARLQHISGIHNIETEFQLPNIPNDAVVIDALFGTGLSRTVEGLSAVCIQAINQSGAEVYAVDIPSGLQSDSPAGQDAAIVHAKEVFTFHAPKLSFLMPSSAPYVPAFTVLDIGLHTGFAKGLPSPYYYTTLNSIKPWIKPRGKFSHKGTYGHALIAAGNTGKMGAAVLSVRATLRSGAGLVTAAIPEHGNRIMQSTNPEAMVQTWNEEQPFTFTDSGFTAVGAGPGWGTGVNIKTMLQSLLQNSSLPLVLDADALNVLGTLDNWKNQLPADTILTPHPGEFKRLVGEWSNDLERLEKLKTLATQTQTIVVLKGAYTAVASPEGNVYFNATGNPGMAKGGSGDVLTGIITSLRAQGYNALQAAMIGVYVHGLAGDLAAKDLGETAMTAQDIIRYLPRAFKVLEPA